MIIQKGRKITKGAAPFLDKGRHLPAADVKIRLEERDRREAADTPDRGGAMARRPATGSLGAGCQTLGRVLI